MRMIYYIKLKLLVIKLINNFKFMLEKYNMLEKGKKLIKKFIFSKFGCQEKYEGKKMLLKMLKKIGLYFSSYFPWKNVRKIIRRVEGKLRENIFKEITTTTILY